MTTKISQAIFLVTLGLSATVFCQTKVTISLSARDLPTFDIWDGAPDPYLILKNSSSGVTIGQTDAPANTQNPDWTTVFVFNYMNFTSEKIIFDLWDDDVDSDDYMGYVEVLLADITSAFGGILEVPFNANASPGRLIIRAKLNATSA